MFVPLPVPLVFQRTAPDFSAWRLKSPLPLRSGDSGKRSLYLPLVNVGNSFSLFPPHTEKKKKKKSKRGAETPVQPQPTVWMKPIFLYFLQITFRSFSVCVCIYFYKNVPLWVCIKGRLVELKRRLPIIALVWMVRLGLFWLLSSFCPPRICFSICRLTLFSRPVQGIFMVIYRFRRDRYTQTAGEKTERVCEFNDKFKNDETECHFICWCFCRF